jgi:hypothetical protein
MEEKSSLNDETRGDTTGDVEPDIIIGYPGQGDCAALNADGGASYAVVYVRPETNNILYERAIVAGIKSRGRPVYMANLNGALFLRDGILEDHYASQFRFARDPCEEVARYPEMKKAFEEHFHVEFERSPLIGAFDAVRLLGMGEEELFETIVPDPDFLGCWGQEFKRIFDFIVANPNLPAILKRYTPESNVFAAVVLSRGADADFFQGLNSAIYAQIVSHHETPVIDGEKLDSLVWSEKIRRTYHISTNHVMAMFDMADFVYVNGSSRLDVADTPLGRLLIGDGAVSAQRLRAAKESPLVYFRERRKSSLSYLPLCAPGKTPRGISEMMRALAD